MAVERSLLPVNRVVCIGFAEPGEKIDSKLLAGGPIGNGWIVAGQLGSADLFDIWIIPNRAQRTLQPLDVLFAGIDEKIGVFSSAHQAVRCQRHRAERD